MPGFRFEVWHNSLGWVAASDGPEFVLNKLWPTNWRQREIAAIELEESGRTINGPYAAIDREHANEKR